MPRLTLLRMGFTKPPGSPRPLVRSYRTVSPLPVIVADPSAVCFLWHFPADHPDWPLASILSCGAPTFLSPIATGPRSPGWLTRPFERYHLGSLPMPLAEVATVEVVTKQGPGNAEGLDDGAEVDVILL